MSTNEAQWNKITHQRDWPNAEQFPIWLFRKESAQMSFFQTMEDMCCNCKWYQLASHWMPTKLEDMPRVPKEETQEEKDYETFVKWWNAKAELPKCDSWPAYIQALRTERAWFRIELEALHSSHALWNNKAIEMVQRMRERCEETP